MPTANSLKVPTMVRKDVSSRLESPYRAMSRSLTSVVRTSVAARAAHQRSRTKKRATSGSTR
jgi:hypothetical protein